ncbi:unnamed protein product, partial [Ostreobium quekettii]
TVAAGDAQALAVGEYASTKTKTTAKTTPYSAKSSSKSSAIAASGRKLRSLDMS